MHTMTRAATPPYNPIYLVVQFGGAILKYS